MPIRSFRYGFLAAAILGSVAACSPSAVTTGNATVNGALLTAQTDAREAETFYGIAKGIEMIACPASSVTSQCVTARNVVKTVDPIILKVDTALATASTDATSLEALVATINGEAIVLENQVAAGVKVVKSTT